MSATVRLAGDADLPTLVRLRAAWTYEQDGDVDDTSYEEAFTAWYARERDQRLTWLAEVGGTAAGMLNLLVFTRMPRLGRPMPKWGYVANAFVLAAYRGQGTGTRLVRAATAYADQHGFARLVLSPSPRSVPLYERQGFGTDHPLLVRRPCGST